MSRVLIDGQALYQASNAMDEIASKQDEYSIYNLISNYQVPNDIEDIIIKNSSMFGSGKHLGSTSVYDLLMNLVYCIILWDEVCVIEEPFVSHYLNGVKYFEECGAEFTILRRGDIEHCPRFVRESIFDQFFEKRIADEDDIFAGKPYYAGNSGGERALGYYLLANTNGMDYAPSVDRQLILQSYDYLSFFSRNDVISILDNELKNYYDQVNSHFLHSRFTYKFPVILDYLLEKYQSIKDIIKSAYELKNKRETMRFRKELDNLSLEFKRGNVQYVEEYFTNIEQLLSDLRNLCCAEKYIDMSVELSPSISFDVNKVESKPFQSVFLKNLLVYGIKERHTLPINSKVYISQ